MSEAYGPAVADTVDRLFTDWADGPGGAVSVLHRGTVVHHRAYGLADVANGVAFSTDQPFGIASVTKQFVAHLILLLEQDGALARGDAVQLHVPELGDLGATVTIEHLLRHRSGIRDHITLATLAGGRLLEGLTREAITRLILGQRSLDFAPDTAAVYSNSNYQLLSWVIERVTGQSLGEVLAARIFRPLGMTSTCLAEGMDRAPSTPIVGYEGTASTGYRVWRSTAYVAGDGGVWSTLDDLARWMQHLDGCTGGSRAAFDEMMRPRPLAGGGVTDYLVGLREGSVLGERCVGHSGGWAGFRSQLVWFPAQRLGVVVIANQTIDPTTAALEVADRFLPPPPPGLVGSYRNGDADTEWTIAADGPSVAVSVSGPFGRIDGLPLRRADAGTLRMTRAALARWDLEFDTEIRFEPAAGGVVRELDVSAGIVRSFRLDRVG